MNRAKQLVEDTDRAGSIAVAQAEKNGGFDSKGRARTDYSSTSEQMLAIFNFKATSRVRVDPASKEVIAFSEVHKGGRSSFLFGGETYSKRLELSREGSDKVYLHKLSNYTQNECQGYTERVRVTKDGQLFYTKTDHMRAYIEGGLRNNPHVRALLWQVAGGAVGGLVGMGVASALGNSVGSGLFSGVTSGAFLGTVKAYTKPSTGFPGVANTLAALPAGAITLASILGTLLSTQFLK